MAYVALLDASVLHPWVLADLLLRLAERGLFRPSWSAEILDELVRSLERRRPEGAEAFRRRRAEMEAYFPEASTADSRPFMPPVPGDVHVDDRHVVAAALAAHADVIVTTNTRHFPPDSLAGLAIAVQTPDEFLIHQWWLRPELVAAEIVDMAAATTKPHLNPDEIVTSLSRTVPVFAGMVAASDEFAVAKRQPRQGA